MPSASDALRKSMGSYFGDEIDDRGPYKFLIQQGFQFSRGGIITHPTKKWDEMSEKEHDCVWFLCDEWDYGSEIP